MSPASGRGDAVLLYSGGTDSTCAAALLAQRFDRVHLLTCEERGTRGSPAPSGNVERLREKYGRERFPHELLSTDALLRRVWYTGYLRFLLRHGFFMSANCGFSSLSWHVRAIAYCLDRGITHAADGVTRELVHFPGHMGGVLAVFRELYAHFGIEYTNPVRDWDTPPDVQFLEKLIVDLHLAPPPDAPGKTTGRYLFEQGLLPGPNIKGSPLDMAMQHACYPFVLFNIFAFWCYLPFHTYEDYERRMTALFTEKAAQARLWLEEYRRRGAQSPLGRWIAP